MNKIFQHKSLMALSKFAISLIAGIGSIAAIGGITAGVVVSNNRNTLNSVEETTEAKNNKEEVETSKSSEDYRRNTQSDSVFSSSEKSTANEKDVNESKHKLDKTTKDSEDTKTSSKDGQTHKETVAAAEEEEQKESDSHTLTTSTPNPEMPVTMEKSPVSMESQPESQTVPLMQDSHQRNEEPQAVQQDPELKVESDREEATGARSGK